ncbi:MAG: hypothetical protein NUW06_08385 [Candidatus Acetothermia bacterium]|nr:hypothetical protein [Candidatus Acetothermia bacterium]MDH7505868.1 hypothetical protein [Candidatus Acetothermia bacterium]
MAEMGGREMFGFVGVEGYLSLDEVDEIVSGFIDALNEIRTYSHAILESMRTREPDFLGFIALRAEPGAAEELAKELADADLGVPIWVFVYEDGEYKLYYANMSETEAEQLACSARPAWCNDGEPDESICVANCGEGADSSAGNGADGNKSDPPPASIGGSGGCNGCYPI